MLSAMSRGFLLFVLIPGAFAQSKGDAESPQRLVRLMVAATNSKGEPVKDLHASDIQVREDGKVHQPVFFHFDGTRRAVESATSGEVVNRPAVTPTLILLDRWNEQMMLATSAWINLGEALQRLESVRRVFIYFLTNHGDLYPVHPLPATDADLRAMAAPTPAELRGKLDEAVKKLQGFRDIDVQDPVLRANTTFRALNALGAQMASIAGRKNFIWVSRGIPLTVRISGGDWLDFTPQVRQLSTAAAQSHIAIYTVDESANGAGADLAGLSRQTLQMVSALTGGRWYPSDNAEPAFAGALSDGQASYRLAYYAPIREKDRKEHKIRVESSQRGVHLLTREGYFGDAVEPDPEELEQAVFSSERRSPFDATEIGLRVVVSPVPSSKYSHFAIHIDPADALLEQRGGNYQGRLALMFASYRQGFLKEATAPLPLDVNLTPDQFKRAQKDGIDASQDLPEAADVDKIRVMVFDRRMFALGSVTVSALK